MVIYVLPSLETFQQALIRRGSSWLKRGKLDLTKPEISYSSDKIEGRIKETAEELNRILSLSKNWYMNQLKVLRELKKRGVKIVFVDPLEIFKKLYKFEIKESALPRRELIKLLEEQDTSQLCEFFREELNKKFLKKEDKNQK